MQQCFSSVVRNVLFLQDKKKENVEKKNKIRRATLLLIILMSINGLSCKTRSQAMPLAIYLSCHSTRLAYTS